MLETIKQRYLHYRTLYIIGGLIGLCIVILMHELGHFLAARIFGVDTPVFSIGFGPALLQIPFNGTTFQIAALPLGGYVEINMNQVAMLSYIPQMIIILAGIFINFMFTYVVFMRFIMHEQHIKTIPTFIERIKTAHNQLFTTLLESGRAATSLLQPSKKNSSFIGPIGIISMISRSLAVNQQFFWLVLALISFNIGVFNLVPLPFFDGGKAVICTVQALTGYVITETLLAIIMLFLIPLSIIILDYYANQRTKK